ncbi:hypothetical protein ON010_g13448 [Phytophthora cinnamomi]|nr:hypothetical protein ON010_g13448 [Phytophthora cinnamomi]
MPHRRRSHREPQPLTVTLHELDGALLREHQVHVPAPICADHDAHHTRRHEGEQHLEAVQHDIFTFNVGAAARERRDEEPRRQHGDVQAAHPDVQQQQPEVSCPLTRVP